MKKIGLIILAISTLIAYGYSQNTEKKIKIILLGTFHFNQSLDSSSKLHSNLFSAQRQKEVKNIVEQLVKQKPDKIFLEFTPKNQDFYDSIYKDYLDGKEPQLLKIKANEYFQLGMQTAKKLGHKRVIGMNYQPLELVEPGYKPKNSIDSAMQILRASFDTFEDSTRTNSVFYDLPFPTRMPKQDSLLQNSTLATFLLHLNSPLKLQKAEYIEWNYLMSMGTDKDMSMTDYVGTFWYGTNLRNYNNVARQVDYKKDKCYLIIYGANHIPFLTYLFKLNPYFEVINLQKILK
jgi:hypothetical protein